MVLENDFILFYTLVSQTTFNSRFTVFRQSSTSFKAQCKQGLNGNGGFGDTTV